MEEHSENKALVCLQQARRQRLIQELSEMWRQSLPAPSTSFRNLIFVYNEQMATQGRELLFDQLDREAHRLGQTLVINDVAYDRGGFYVDFDQIGVSGEEADYERFIDHWNKM